MALHVADEVLAKLQALVGKQIKRVAVLDDADPNGADPWYVVIETVGGELVTFGDGNDFVKFLHPDDGYPWGGKGFPTDKQVEKLDWGMTLYPRDSTTPVTASRPGDIGPGEGDCTCIGEIGEDPQCVVHGKPIE